ncbi:inactive peptidyl-prolyl cis-trans isomerase FKBP6-like [Dreissena polymorpha]|uniref:peptidylprolyl isomerase n=1 Tax=Dreissena polymorpha TaxID=45954 RepID=A0A9D4S2B6_DREPO|nr:inactive peptidyl-prolyl cis-trans isomerase FKBP6-like [Dreissena polymorpha]XP_052239935.1 inactive peptidyl-prolyl cis-trans isomerase FKBP6-like [Dreissena polymorpha]KAH3889949.1 hypothetical protein DPMN_014016 [Dreissena polymorpha]
MGDEEKLTVSLKGGLNLRELRESATRTGSYGVLFEVEEEEAPCDEELEYEYHKHDVYNHLLHVEEEEEEEDDECTLFEKLARKMEDICPSQDKGILKQVLRPGSGPTVTEGSLCRMHFNIYTEHGDEPFDSTRLRNKIAKLCQGRGEMIEGLDVGLATMRKGEVARFLIKPDYALGKMGAPPRIPENATLLAEVELLSFVEQADIDDYFEMTEEQKRNVSWADLKKVYHSITNNAKELFEDNKIRQAFPKYKKAATVLEDRHLRDQDEEADWRGLLLKTYLNLSVCAVKLAHAGRAIYYCKKCYEMDKKPNAKVLYLHGKALRMQCDFDRARDYLVRAQKLKPRSSDINSELEKLESDVLKYRMTETSMYRKMLSQPVGTTQEEEEKENRRVEAAKNKSEACSEEFRKTVSEKLREFSADRDLTEFPIPSYNLSHGEIYCIIEVAESLGLDAKVRGTGNSSQLRVMKRPRSST